MLKQKKAKNWNRKIKKTTKDQNIPSEIGLRDVGWSSWKLNGNLGEIDHLSETKWASLAAQLVKNHPAMRETLVQFLGFPLEMGKPTHSSILAWRIPWTV